MGKIAPASSPTALTLDTFNRHADKLAMANVAQFVNNLHSLFLAHEDKFTAFHVFEMNEAHAGRQAWSRPSDRKSRGKAGRSFTRSRRLR